MNVNYLIILLIIIFLYINYISKSNKDHFTNTSQYSLKTDNNSNCVVTVPGSVTTQYYCENGQVLDGKDCIDKTLGKTITKYYCSDKPNVIKDDNECINKKLGEEKIEYTCEDGQVLQNNKCIKTVSGKIEDKYICSDGYYLNKQTNKCVKEVQGQIENNYHCKDIDNAILDGDKCIVNTVGDTQLKYECNDEYTLEDDKCVKKINGEEIIKQGEKVIKYTCDHILGSILNDKKCILEKKGTSDTNDDDFVLEDDTNDDDFVLEDDTNDGDFVLENDTNDGDFVLENDIGDDFVLEQFTNSNNMSTNYPQSTGTPVTKVNDKHTISIGDNKECLMYVPGSIETRVKCPDGTVNENGKCIKYIFGDVETRITCPQGSFLENDKCIKNINKTLIYEKNNPTNTPTPIESNTLQTTHDMSSDFNSLYQ